MLIYPAAKCYLHDCRVNKYLFTRQSGRQWAIHPTAVQITFIHLAVISLLKGYCTCQLHVNQTDGIRAFSDVENSFLFTDLAVKATKSENKKGFSTKPNFSDHSLQHRTKESSAKNALNCIEQPHFT